MNPTILRLKRIRGKWQLDDVIFARFEAQPSLAGMLPLPSGRHPSVWPRTAGYRRYLTPN
jgi:hypothetical protein